MPAKLQPLVQPELELQAQGSQPQPAEQALRLELARVREFQRPVLPSALPFEAQPCRHLGTRHEALQLPVG